MQPENLTDAELLQAVSESGSRLFHAARTKQSGVGSLTDDPRWASPIPLRFEIQLATLFLGAIEAYDTAFGLLRQRASQQVFGVLRFQMETLALMLWLTEINDEQERKVRAYRVVCGQIGRWVKLLREDAGDDPDALATVSDAEKWEARLRELATEDGIRHLRPAPGRSHLLRMFGHEGAHPTFSMFSELGSHPGALGNVLFSLNSDARSVTYSFEGAEMARAFWLSAAIVYLAQTCEVVARSNGWDEWFSSEVRPVLVDAEPLMAEALQRKKRERMAGER